MSNFIKSLWNYTKNIRTTGALYETSARIERAICKKVTPSAKVVVEFGTGLGNITQQILKQLPEDGKLYSMEVNADFLKEVKKTISDPRLTLINDGAQNFPDYIPEQVDIFISSIPVTLIPDHIVEEILTKSNAALQADGYFCQVLYSPFHKRKFQKSFKNVVITTVWSVPAGFIHFCQKK